MTNPILVAYATKFGATAEIAAKIGDTLQQAGWSVDVLPADQVKDAAAYTAIVLGSAVYAGTWRTAAVDFLEANQAQLTDRAVWLFSSGPTGEGDASHIMQGWRFPEAQQAIAERIQPRDIAFFHGFINMQKLNLAEKVIVTGIKAPTGDFRNWAAVTAWATEIAQALSVYRN